MGVLRADIFGALMRETMLNGLLNQDGVPLKDWKNSTSFLKNMDSVVLTESGANPTKVLS